MKPLQLRARLFLLMAAILAVPLPAFAQVAPSLGTAADFAVLGGTTVTNTGPTLLQGSLGVSPGSAITGFPPGIVIGETHAADVDAAEAQADTTTAFNALAAQACDTTFAVPTDLGGMVLVPGVYCFASSASLTGVLTLDGEGDPNAVFIFKTGSTLITASGSSVLLINGASPCNVFFQVGSSATLGTGSNFVGNILALTSITLNTGATLSGRALARNGAVTVDSNAVAITTCAVIDGGMGDAGMVDGGVVDGGVAGGGVADGGVADGGVADGGVPPKLKKHFSPSTIYTGGLSTLTLTLINANATPAILTAPLVDNLPTGVLVAGAASTTCGGIVTTSTSTVTLTGGTIPANDSCTVTVPVSATVAGCYVNTLPAGALQTTNGRSPKPAEAVLTVIRKHVPAPPLPPVLHKEFYPANIAAGRNSRLTITLTNRRSTVALLLAPLTDLLPRGLLIVGNASTTCSGTLTAIPGASTITLRGGAIPAMGSCTVTVNVAAAYQGSYCNKLPRGALDTDQGKNEREATATLTVYRVSRPPTLEKAFSPASITAGGSSTLTITLRNPNATAATLTGALTDYLPHGLVVCGSASTTCGGTLAAGHGGSRVVLSGGSIPALGSCTVTVVVTAAHQGTYKNKMPPGALRTDHGHNSAAAYATLTVRHSSGWCW